MDTIGLISAIISVSGAVLTGSLSYWFQRRTRAVDRRNYMDRYGASLAWAAFELQSRVFNILAGQRAEAVGTGQGFLTFAFAQPAGDQAEYARRSTVFVFAEYLAWVEILRRDIQFLDLGRNRVNRRVMRQVAQISHTLARMDLQLPGEDFRVFRTAQRAIGEVMIRTEDATGQRHCRGYADFCRALEEDETFRGWFSGLLGSVDRFVADPVPALPRLAMLQHQLVGLIDLLDPRRVRFPREQRTLFRQAES